MERRKKTAVIDSIAGELTISADIVRSVVNLYEKKIEVAVKSAEIINEPVNTTIVGFDGITIFPGLSLIYGMDSTGKSSFAKRIARGLHESGRNVLFVEADGKLTQADVDCMAGVFHTEDTSGKSIHSLLSYHLIDAIVVDSLTAMNPATQRYLLHHAMKTVPYVIGVTQMRYNSSREMILPACPDTVSSMARTHFYMSDPLPINMDGIDMVKTSVNILKHPHDDIRGATREAVIYGNIVHNSLSAYYALSNAGRISSMGLVKYVDTQPIGGVHDIITKQEKAKEIISLLWPDDQHGNNYSTDPVLKLPERRKVRGAAYIAAHRH